MTKIYFIGDTHFGRKYSYLLDYELNISKRNLDVIDNCEVIIKDAITNHADYVIFLGDVYDRQVISPTIRKIIRRRIFNPLFNANISVIIIGGNHDSFRSPKRGVDLEELSIYPNVEVITNFSERIIKKNGSTIGILCLPYIHYDILLSLAQENGYDIPDKLNTYSTAQTIIQTYISQICEDSLKECDKRILSGHYYLKGSKFQETSNLSSIYGEFQVNEQMIQKKYFDLVMFGHVHLHQSLYNDDRIIVLGSTDRIDMGERNSKKYYAIYEPEKNKLDFKELQCRTLLSTEIEVPNTIKQMTEYVIQKLPDQNIVKNAVCQITVKHSKGKHIQIDKKVIEKYFSESFFANITYVEQSEEDLHHLRNANLAPLSLFEDFMEQKYHQHEHYEDLKKIGSEMIEVQLKTSEITEKGAISIRSINVQNFNKYGKGPNKIIFDKDLYVITGPTGTGKSSLLDAITFALFKKSVRRDAGLTIDEILYEDGYVELELLVGENILHVKRNKNQPKLQISINNSKSFQGLSIPEKEKKLEDIIGYDYEGFISSFFIRQQELQIFSSLTSAERQERLAKLFKLKIFQNMDKILQDRIKNLEKQHGNLEGEIKTRQEDIKTLPELEENLVNAEKGLKQINLYINNQKKVVTEIKKEMDELDSKKSKYNAISEKIVELELAKNQTEKDLNRYNQEQLKYKKIKDELKEYEDLNKEIKETQKVRDQLKDKNTLKILIESHIQNEKNSITRIESHFQNQIHRFKQEITKQQSRLKDISSDMNKEQAFNILKKGGRLIERLSRLQNIEIPMAIEYSDNSRLKLFNSSKEETEKEISIVESQQDLITKDVFIADELYGRITKLEEEIKEFEEKRTSELKPSILKIQSLQRELKEKKLDAEIEQQLKTTENTLKSLEHRQNEKETLEKSIAKQQDYTTLIQKANDDITQIKEKIKDYKANLENLKPAYEEYQKCAVKLEKDEQELKVFEANKEGVNVRIQFLKNDIQKLHNLKKKIHEDEEKLNELKSEIEIHTILRKYVFHLDGIPKFALEKILPAISIRASEILGDLTDGRLNHIEFIPLEEHRIGFDIYVFDGELKREAGTYSGGEKTQINAAIRFAIMERIDEIPETAGAVFRKSDTLFIDEGDLGTLDDEYSRQLFIDKIIEMKSRFKNIILITHLEDVAEQFPNRIKIGRASNGKSIIMSK